MMSGVLQAGLSKASVCLGLSLAVGGVYGLAAAQLCAGLISVGLAFVGLASTGTTASAQDRL